MRILGMVFAAISLPATAFGGVVFSQAPVSGGGVSRSSQLWQDPSPAGNDLDGDAVCWQDFVLSGAATITHMEWWGSGAAEQGFKIEFWRQDPGTIAYQPLGVFYYGGNHSIAPEPPGFIKALPGSFTTSAGPGGLTHYSFDLPTPVSLAANDSSNPRWFVGVVGLTSQAYATWNWAQGSGPNPHTFQFIRAEGPSFRSLGDGRALLLADAVVPEADGASLLAAAGSISLGLHCIRRRQ